MDIPHAAVADGAPGSAGGARPGRRSAGGSTPRQDVRTFVVVDLGKRRCCFASKPLKKSPQLAMLPPTARKKKFQGRGNSNRCGRALPGERCANHTSAVVLNNQIEILAFIGVIEVQAPLQCCTRRRRGKTERVVAFAVQGFSSHHSECPISTMLFFLVLKVI